MSVLRAAPHARLPYKATEVQEQEIKCNSAAPTEAALYYVFFIVFHSSLETLPLNTTLARLSSF